jgi:hypothetical protein
LTVERLETVEIVQKIVFHLLLLSYILGACQAETSPDLSASYAKNHALHSSFLESELTVDKHSSQDSTIRIITFGHIYHLQDESKLLNDLVT